MSQQTTHKHTDILTYRLNRPLEKEKKEEETLEGGKHEQNHQRVKPRYI